jgi:hypothetical protein
VFVTEHMLHGDKRQVPGSRCVGNRSLAQQGPDQAPESCTSAASHRWGTKLVPPYVCKELSDATLTFKESSCRVAEAGRGQGQGQSCGFGMCSCSAFRARHRGALCAAHPPTLIRLNSQAHVQMAARCDEMLPLLAYNDLADELYSTRLTND